LKYKKKRKPLWHTAMSAQRLFFSVVFFEKKAGKWESLSRNCQYNSWNLFSDNPKYGNFSGIPHSLNEKFFVTLGKKSGSGSLLTAGYLI